MTRPLCLVLALALAAGACTGGAAAPAPSSSAAAASSTSAATAVMSDAALEEEVASLVELATEVRGLEFVRTPEVVVSDAAELGPDVEPPAEPTAAERRLYQLLGMASGPGPAPESPPAIARYESDADRIVVARPDGQLSPLSRQAIVRELVRGLAAQNLDRGGRVHDRAIASDEEAGRALDALIEGDAAFFAASYASAHFSEEERFAAQLEELSRTQAAQVGGDTPALIRFERTFPREAGAGFVAELVGRGGSAAVDEAYLRPPVSAEQVLHPARYFAGEVPIAVAVPEPAPPGYRLVGSGTWGEAGIRALLGDVLGEAEALQAGRGWGGDAYALWWDGSDVVLVSSYRGDEAADAAEYGAALRRRVLEAMPVGAGRSDWRGVVFEGVDAYAFVGVVDDRVIFVAATDAGAGRVVRDTYWPAV